MTFLDDFVPGREAEVDPLNAILRALPLFAYKSSDTTRTNATTGSTFVDDPHLTLATPAISRLYTVDLSLIYATAAAADIKISWTLPTGATLDNWTARWRTHDGTEVSTSVATGTTTLSITATAGAGVDQTIVARGLLIMSTTVEPFALRWAQNTADAGNTILRRNSWLRLVAVA